MRLSRTGWGNGDDVLPFHGEWDYLTLNIRRGDKMIGTNQCLGCFLELIITEFIFTHSLTS